MYISFFNTWTVTELNKFEVIVVEYLSLIVHNLPSKILKL